MTHDYEVCALLLGFNCCLTNAYHQQVVVIWNYHFIDGKCHLV